MNTIKVIEQNNQRVLTTQQIAEGYGTDSKVISYNFNNNKQRYEEGKHYFCLTGEAKREFCNRLEIHDGAKATNFYLWTEKGALLHAKSLNTEQAWAVYDELVETYFRAKQICIPDSYMIDDPVERAKRWIQEQEQRKQLETTVAVQTQQLAELQPKASYYDVVLNSKDLLSASQIAKDYGKSAVWLNKYLHEKGIQYKTSTKGNWLLYQKYAEQGYTSTKTSVYNGNDGAEHTKVHTYWTQKGRLFIYDLFKCDGILPLIEREA